MKGLILKDFINMKSQLKVYILVVAFCLIISMLGTGPEAISGLTAMFAVLIPITAEAYDRQSNWNRFALSMPVSKRELVLSKYIFMEIMLIIMTGITFSWNFIWFVRCYSPWYTSLVQSFFVATLLFIIANVIFAVMMPIIFRFGVEKGRGILLGIAVALVALFGIFQRGGSNGVGAYYMDILESGFNKYSVLILMFIIAMIIEMISIRISIKIYKRKDF